MESVYIFRTKRSEQIVTFCEFHQILSYCIFNNVPYTACHYLSRRSRNEVLSKFVVEIVDYNSLPALRRRILHTSVVPYRTIADYLVNPLNRMRSFYI